MKSILIVLALVLAVTAVASIALPSVALAECDMGNVGGCEPVEPPPFGGLVETLPG